MRIDRSNYETWFIDWLDGNLGSTEVDQLKQFLVDNPDLKEELDDLAIVRLNPSDKSFSKKSHLKKTNDDLSESQFEYLSVAYLENDLSSEQKEELLDSIAVDKGKKKSFELMQKTRLLPLASSYNHKNRLIKRTIFQNAIRLSITGLSAAAIITLAVISYFSKPKSQEVIIKNTAQTIHIDSTIHNPVVKIARNELKTEKKVIADRNKTLNLPAPSTKVDSVAAGIIINQPEQGDYPGKFPEFSSTSLNKIPISTGISIQGEMISNKLVALNLIASDQNDDDDGRPRLGKMIAKAFRGKILKEKMPKDTPLKVYEIAEAGVAGLNKLLGWQMALDKKNDENGELKSVYFSSKILKFNAPVKKSEPPQ
jgi:hypothetical protein